MADKNALISVKCNITEKREKKRKRKGKGQKEKKRKKNEGKQIRKERNVYIKIQKSMIDF